MSIFSVISLAISDARAIWARAYGTGADKYC